MNTMRKYSPYFILLLLALTLLTVAPAVAQTPTPNEVNAIARELWCPLCNGVRLDNCELQACVQMREVIAEKLAAGEDKQAIKAYFVTQYGDVVLGAPSGEGFNIVVWVLPVLVGLIGVGWLVYFVTTNRKAPAPQPTAPITSKQAAAEDEYVRRVEDELKKSD